MTTVPNFLDFTINAVLRPTFIGNFIKHANSILESLEYFCQISSKLILIIFSYTVSKLVHFLRHSVEQQEKK